MDKPNKMNILNFMLLAHLGNRKFIRNQVNLKK